jgi:hypothetical protein
MIPLVAVVMPPPIVSMARTIIVAAVVWSIIVIISVPWIVVVGAIVRVSIVAWRVIPVAKTEGEFLGLRHV